MTMKKVLFKKSQLNEAFSKESDATIPFLLKEASFEELANKFQEGDIVHILRINRDNRRLKVTEVKQGKAYFFDVDKKFHAILKNWNPEEGQLTIVNIGKPIEDGGIKKQNTEITLGPAKSLALERDEEIIAQTESEIEDKYGEDDPNKGKKKPKDVLNRQKELRETLSSADVGDIIRLITGQIEDEEITNETTIDLKVDDRRAAGSYIMSLESIEGPDKSKYSELEKADQIIADNRSVQFKGKDPNTFEFLVGLVKGDERYKRPLNDMLVLDVIRQDEQEAEKKEKDDEDYDSAYEEAKDKLSDDKVKELMRDPLMRQALKLDIELERLMAKVKKGKKNKEAGKKKGLFKDKEKVRFKWISDNIGEKDYEIEKGIITSGRYKADKNVIEFTESKADNEYNRKLTYIFKDIKKTKQENKYKVKVDVIEGGKRENTLMEDEEGIIKVIDQGS